MARGMDIVFVQDVTESQEDYIEASKNSIVEICYFLRATGRVAPGCLRVGLIAFRDYSDEPVFYDYGFTTDAKKLQENLAALRASGGDDGPEAVEYALHAVSKTVWASGSVRIVVLITDAPPHRLGEYGDLPAHKERAKDYDPLRTAWRLAQDGVVVYIMACEPVLSGRYRYAVDFYSSLAKITSGAMYPLTQPNLLASCIIGSALEALEIRALSEKHQAEIAKRFFELKEPIEDIVDAVMEKLGSGQQKHKVTTVNVATIYRNTPETKHNLKALMGAKTLNEAKLIPIIGARCIPGYLSYKEEFAEGTISAGPTTIEVSNSGGQPINIEMWNPKSEVLVSFNNTGNQHIAVEVHGSKFSDEDQCLAKSTFWPSKVERLPFPIGAVRNFVLTLGSVTKYFSRTITEAMTTLDLGQLWALSAPP